MAEWFESWIFQQFTSNKNKKRRTFHIFFLNSYFMDLLRNLIKTKEIIYNNIFIYINWSSDTKGKKYINSNFFNELK